jgi:hypothetical protein
MKRLVDVAGLEPATPCLQSRAGKTLTALFGVAYTEITDIPALSNVPKLYRISASLLPRLHGVGYSGHVDHTFRGQNGVATAYQIQLLTPLTEGYSRRLHPKVGKLILKRENARFGGNLHFSTSSNGFQLEQRRARK